MSVSDHHESMTITASTSVETLNMCSCIAQWLSIASAVQKVVGSIPREHTYRLKMYSLNAIVSRFRLVNVNMTVNPYDAIHWHTACKLQLIVIFMAY